MTTPEMHVKLESELCSGCGNCSEIAPNVFQLDEESGVSYIKVIGGLATGYEEQYLIGVPVTDSELDNVTRAAEECPGEIIFIEQS